MQQLFIVWTPFDTYYATLCKKNVTKTKTKTKPYLCTYSSWGLGMIHSSPFTTGGQTFLKTGCNAWKDEE